MGILIVMGIGILIGNKFFNPKYRKIIEKIQAAATVLLIFAMGVSLGKRPGLLSELSVLGWKSFLFFLIPASLSTLLVYILTRKFLPNAEGSRGGEQ